MSVTWLCFAILKKSTLLNMALLHALQLKADQGYSETQYGTNNYWSQPVEQSFSGKEAESMNSFNTLIP